MPSHPITSGKQSAVRSALFSCALAAVCAAGPAHAAFKCKDAAGKVSFQDAPCAGGGGQELTLQPNGSTTGNGTAADALPYTPDVVQAAIREHRPVVGMTVAQLNEAMGLATLINTDQIQGVLHEQVIFERPNETWYVYTRNGRVQSIQHRPGPPLSARRFGSTPTGRSNACPSAHEIKNAKTAASSISLSRAERNDRLRHIRDMENCR